MAEFILKHVRHPAYASTVATGVVISGPSTDGLVQATFYRELLIPVEEYFNREEREVAGGAGLEVKLTLDRPGKIDQVREDVVTVQMQRGHFKAFVKALGKMVEGLEAAEKGQQGAGNAD